MCHPAFYGAVQGVLIEVCGKIRYTLTRPESMCYIDESVRLVWEQNAANIVLRIRQ